MRSASACLKQRRHSSALLHTLLAFWLTDRRVRRALGITAQLLPGGGAGGSAVMARSSGARVASAPRGAAAGQRLAAQCAARAQRPHPHGMPSLEPGAAGHGSPGAASRGSNPGTQRAAGSQGPGRARYGAQRRRPDGRRDSPGRASRRGNAAVAPAPGPR
jgi:hypothetical protein